MSTMSWVYNNVNQSSPELAQHAQLAIRTPHGLGMAPFMRPLLEPLLDRPLVTFAE